MAGKLVLCDAHAWELAFSLLRASEQCAQPCLYKQTIRLLVLQKTHKEVVLIKISLEMLLLP